MTIRNRWLLLGYEPNGDLRRATQDYQMSNRPESCAWLWMLPWTTATSSSYQTLTQLARLTDMSTPVGRLKKGLIHCIRLADVGDCPWYCFWCLEVGNRNGWKVQVQWRHLNYWARSFSVWSTGAIEQMLVIWRADVVSEPRITLPELD